MTVQASGVAARFQDVLGDMQHTLEHWEAEREKLIARGHMTPELWNVDRDLGHVRNDLQKLVDVANGRPPRPSRRRR